jgi:hypothetical protein
MWRWRTLEPLAGKEIGHRLQWFKRAMTAGGAIRRMRATEQDGAFGRCELTAAECTALFDLGLASGTFFDAFAVFAADGGSEEQPAAPGSGVQLALLEVA